MVVVVVVVRAFAASPIVVCMADSMASALESSGTAMVMVRSTLPGETCTFTASALTATAAATAAATCCVAGASKSCTLPSATSSITTLGADGSGAAGLPILACSHWMLSRMDVWSSALVMCEPTSGEAEKSAKL